MILESMYFPLCKLIEILFWIIDNNNDMIKAHSRNCASRSIGFATNIVHSAVVAAPTADCTDVPYSCNTRPRMW